MTERGFWGEVVDENVARKIADIIGPGSSYGQALAEAQRRRDGGEDVVLIKTKGAVVVVPRENISNVTQLPTQHT